MKRNYTIKALSDEQLKFTLFSPNYFQKVNRIEEIIINCIPGLTVLSGNRGVGKSTIINYYLNKFKDKKDYLFFKFNLTKNNNNFFRDVFTYVENINLDSEKIDENTKSEIISLIKSLKYEIFFNVIHEEIINKEHLVSQESKDQAGFKIKIPFVEIFNFNGSISESRSEKDKDLFQTKIIKTKNFYKDDIQNKLIKILNLISNYYKVFFIIDELDKMDNLSFNSFVLENKMLFLEADLSFFFIIDKEKCIDLQYNNSLMESIIRENIYISNLEWPEFLIIASRMDTDISVNQLREAFYNTRGNYRKLINLQLYNKNRYHIYKQTDSLKCFLLFNYFMNIPYIANLPDLIKDFVKDFLYEVIDTFIMVGPLSKNELEKISENYSENTILCSVISRLIHEVINLNDYEKIILPDNSILREEIKKYHQPKKLYYNSFKKLHKYNILEIDTPELKDWLYYIEAWIDCIDFICICKQETEKIDSDTGSANINYLSYHCNIFVSNDYIEPTIFLNSEGFAWIHEYGNRKNTLIEFLDDLGLFYLVIDLEDNVLNREFLKSQNNFRDLEKKILEKYDSKL
ncbi:hypothetical protein [Psychrobacillus vulpis]|uniref:Uncharacterized protein n=1 Tax=Psychrobacillus vulpis TaxID=2325572 RepID=A0A544TR44_9BACI|nr:hypothetical protein [Psychrobacillus vulpis]TQR19920.1 hypothetical protein FG384_09660 [Psychrobacillus vulpis]